MLLQTILLVSLSAAWGSNAAVALSPTDEIPALPTALSGPDTAMLSALLPVATPLKEEPTDPQKISPATKPAADRTQDRNKSLREMLTRVMKGRKHHAVKIVLASRRTVSGRLASVDAESFTIRANPRSAPVLIRYQDVLGFPKEKLNASEEVGRDVLMTGIVILMLPALPLIFVALSTGLISD